MPKGYPIGHVLWSHGYECTVKTAPYELYGGWWQDCITKSSERPTITIKCPS